MFCIKCFHSSTKVINSRTKKKQALTWRRRQCTGCHTVFTTHEKPALEYNRRVFGLDGSSTAFNLGKLILSIARAFSHAQEVAEQYAFSLAETVEQHLSTQNNTITHEEIAATVHAVLKRFDELAALQYAAQHDLIVSTRKRGRPSTAWRG